jgi:hypothetical protein
VIKSYSEKIEGQGRQYQAMHVEECVAAGLTESLIMSLRESVEIMQVMGFRTITDWCYLPD